MTPDYSAYLIDYIIFIKNFENWQKSHLEKTTHRQLRFTSLTATSQRSGKAPEWHRAVLDS